MRKFHKSILCILICLTLLPLPLLAEDGGGGPPPMSAGALEGMDTDGDGNYIVSSNTAVTSSDSINLNLGSITINEGVTLTVEANASMFLRGITITNNGELIIHSESSPEANDQGIFELGNDSYYDEEEGDITVRGQLFNNGRIEINGLMEINFGAKISNTGTINVNRSLRIAGGSELINTDGGITGNECGEIQLDNPPDAETSLIITDLAFYESAEAETETADLNGQFRYSPEKWIRANFGGGGDDSGGGDPAVPLTITILPIANGSISLNGASVSGDVTVYLGENLHFNVTPDPGYELMSLSVDGRALDEREYMINGDGEAIYDIDNVQSGHTISAAFRPRDWRIDISFGLNGMMSDPQTVAPGEDSEPFTFYPDEGCTIGTLTVTGNMTGTIDIKDNLVNNHDGTFSVIIADVTEDLLLSVSFIRTEVTIEGILEKIYAILDSDAEADATAALSSEMLLFGYLIPESDINIIEINRPGADDAYGTFSFTVSVDGEASEVTTAYIVKEFDNVLFKFSGYHYEDAIDEILVAHTSDFEIGEFEVPAMDIGRMEVFGAYNARIAGILSDDMEHTFINNEFDHPFYRVQLHIVSDSGAYGMDMLNWFGLNLIQADAYSLKVSAFSTELNQEQRTCQWELNKYAQLTEGDYISEVFFGNDEFLLSLPSPGIGAITSLDLQDGIYPGYEVIDNDDGTYLVRFFSDFYDRVTLNLTINATITRRLIVHRVGVHIESYQHHQGQTLDHQVSHGTQYSTKIDYSDGNRYRIYASYYIPDDETVAPYGLYVTYTWANGTVTTDIITEPCDDPAPAFNAESYSNGVFHYQNSADCCDYLLYAASNSSNSPVRINVTVLKADPTSGSDFGGIFFGSGAGVEWVLD